GWQYREISLAASTYRHSAISRKVQRLEYLDYVSDRSSSGEARPFRGDAADPILLQSLPIRGGLQQRSTHHGQLANSILRRKNMKKYLLIIIIFGPSAAVSADTIK